MRIEDLDARWHQLAEDVITGMKEWRLQHPKATYREIETALDERLARVRARMLEDAALVSRAAEWDRVKISPKHREGGQNSRNLLLLSSECAKGQARQADCQRRPQANLTWLKPNQQASRELHVQTW